MTPSSITGRRWLGSLLACLALAAVPRGVSGQEGRLRLELPEVVVVGEGLPVIPVQRPLRPLPRKLSADRIVVLPTEEETLRPPVSIAFDPGPAFTPKVARPNDCYKSPSSARRLINQEGARAHFRVGYLFFLSNEMFEAEAQFQAGLDKSPDAVTASFLGYWLGEAYLRRGEEAKAREAWAPVAGNPVGPLAGSASFRLGLMSYRQGDYPEALARMERVVERFPGHPQAAAAAFLAGESSLKMGDSIRAVWHYAGVPQTLTDRGNRELLKLSKFREGMTLFRLKRFPEASRSLGAFSELPGVEADLLRPSRLTLGWSLYHNGRRREAKKTFSEILKSQTLAPGSGTGTEAMLGWLLSALALGREEEARRVWTELKKVRPVGRFSLWGALALGGRFGQSGRFEAAAQPLGEVLSDIEKADSRKTEKLMVRVRLLRAISLYNTGGRYAEAASAFQTVSDSAADVESNLRIQGMYGLVLARLRAGQPEAAAAAAKSFQGRFPSAALLNEVRFWRGESLLRMKRFADARADFETIPKNHVRGAEAALGRAYAFNGEALWLEASKAFGQAAELLSGKLDLRAEAMLRKAEAHFNARNYEEAGKTYRRVLSDFPDSPKAKSAALGLGEMLFRRADYPGAEDAFAEFLRRWPRSGRRDEALYRQGISQIRGGRFTLARVSLGRLVRDFPESRFRKAALLQIGHAYYNEGRFDESADSYQRVLLENPSSEEAREARYGRVLTRLRSGNTEQFIRDVRSLIQKEPDHKLATTLQFQVAEIYLAQKRYSDAVAAYVRVLRKGGRESDIALFRIGEIKRLEGKPVEAADYFRDLLEKFPDSRVRGDARFRLAESLGALGDCEGALAEYRLFILQHPSHSLLTQARYAAGTCALRLKNQEAAEKLFSQVVRSSGWGNLVARSHYELGRFAREKGRFDESLSHMEAASKGGVSPKLQPRLQFELGSLRQSLKQYPRAVVEYLKVVYLHPREKALGSRALMEVAGIYELQGKRARALDLYRKVRKESPEPSVRERARTRIVSLKKSSNGKPKGSAEKVR